MENKLKLSYKKILMMLLYLVLFVVGVYLAFKLAIFYMPFLIAYIIYKLIKRPSEFLVKKFKLPKAISVILCIILFITIIGGIGYLFFSSLIREIVSLSQSSSHLVPKAYNTIMDLISRFTFFYKGLDLSQDVIDTIENSFSSAISTILTAFSNFLNILVTGIYNFVVSLPQVLVYIIITFLATFFISSDNKYIRESLENHVPKKWLDKLSSVINDLFAALGGYVKAELIMMSITCFELFIFFTLYKIEYALILAIVIAIIDALPILGTGTVLIPWALVCLITGNYQMAFYLIIMYLFVTVMRQLLEPKIVGSQIGIYPLLTLIAMYTGVQLIGVFGLIVGPIVLIILKSILSGIYTRGMIKDIFEVEEVKEAEEVEE
ncbi:MAG: sporulation integral membrane protein YtvI [Clostridia bacterium]|nr:sporulation integral membrane protein YtvI [Clostridia bacterium]